MQKKIVFLSVLVSVLLMFGCSINKLSIDEGEQAANSSLTRKGRPQPDPEPEPEPTNPPPTGTLIWSEEFDGTSLDDSIWSYDIGTGVNGWGNNEDQYYTSRPENVSVADGLLTITAIKESYEGMGYTSGRITTKGKYEPQYGRIDLRAKLPEGKGVWPAFWMLGSNFDTAGWPYCGELDIMEMFGENTGTNLGTVHWWADDANTYASYGGETTYDINTFHTFTVAWDAQFIRWYVDDVQFHEIDITPSHLDEFKQPMYMILNLAVGGDKGAGQPRRNSWPQELVVDYIKIYSY